MKVGREGILGEILKEILGEILEKHVLKSIRRRRILEGGRVGGWCVSTQSQGRGHGEAGGLQYQTPNSKMEELFGEEELGSRFRF